MRGGADELHAAFLRAVVRLRALERGQERVVDVDRVRRVPVAERVRQHLHVPSHHQRVRAVLLDERLNLRLLRRLRLDFVAAELLRFHGEMEERDPELVRDVLQVGVVADDERDLALELAVRVAHEQIPKAVVDLAHQDADAVRVGVVRNVPRVHLELAREVLDAALERRAVIRAAEQTGEVDGKALEEHTVVADVLRGAQDVAPATEHELRQARHEPLAVGADETHFRDERPVIGVAVRRRRPRENARRELHFLDASGFARGLGDGGRDRARTERVSLRAARRKARGGFDSRQRPSAPERFAAPLRAHEREGRGGGANAVCERGGHRLEMGTRVA
mmetsp:Transcript_9707/g.40731  ORF Transcript_9707/g.40731 Transcript_9707/m.40731 type:complete len:336 (+) Transcript_9707:329-1336(+)